MRDPKRGRRILCTAEVSLTQHASFVVDIPREWCANDKALTEIENLLSGRQRWQFEDFFGRAELEVWSPLLEGDPHGDHVVIIDDEAFDIVSAAEWTEGAQVAKTVDPKRPTPGQMDIFGGIIEDV
jgi:hypothetical protein